MCLCVSYEYVSVNKLAVDHNNNNNNNNNNNSNNVWAEISLHQRAASF